MYKYESSFLKTRKGNYKNHDILHMKMKDIMSEFVDGYIVLSHSIFKGTHYLTMEALRSAKVIMSTEADFHTWLGLNARLELPTVKEQPEYQFGVVKYADAFYAGFKVNMIGRNKTVKDNIPASDMIDLYLEKNVSDKRKLYRNLLVTVNGFIHRTVPHENGIAVLHGGETFMNCGYNTVGILSFANAPELKQVPITENMIVTRGQINPIKESIVLKLPETLVGKKVLFVLGGILLTDDRIIDILSYEESIVKINLKHLDLIKMMYNAVGSINLEPLGVFPTETISQARKLRVNEVLSDIVLKKFLTLSQSFFVVLEADHVEMNLTPLNETDLPDYYEIEGRELDLPLVTSTGRLPEYWKRKYGDDYGINVSHDITKRRMKDWNVDYHNETVNSISPTYKWFHDKPYILEIKTVKKL